MGVLMGVVAGRGAIASIVVLLVDSLTIQSGQTTTVAPIRVDDDGGGRGDSGCTLGRICSRERTSDEVVYDGVPKPKSMTAP
jgi:hypothetical protein